MESPVAPLDLSTIQKLSFPEDHYYKAIVEKRQITIHHTASGRGIDGDFTHWLTDPQRIATCVIIGHDGTIYQLFESKYWGHHLGITSKVFREFGIKRKESSNMKLNQESIAIEIDSWGPLCFIEGAYHSYTGAVVSQDEVQEYYPPFKTLPRSKYFDAIDVTGKPAHFYQKYTEQQIRSLAQLLELWTDGYSIPKTYNEDMWDVSREALLGTPGIWTHVSYRSDKQDCAPQPELIDMLKSLSK